MSSSSQTVDASLIIPNWNGEPHLRDCLDAVRNQDRSPIETILVDDGSSDGSLQLVTQEYPWVTIIALPEHLGLAAAVNRGVKAGRSRFIALLNNDTQLDPDWLAILVEALQTHPDAGFVGGKTLDFYRRNVIDAAGEALTPGGVPYSRGAGEPDDGRYSTREYVFSVPGGAAVYRKEVFDRVGLFDEDFVCCFEDQDLAFRAQLAGFKCLYVPEALCYHKQSAAGSRPEQHPVRMAERNLTALCVKNVPWVVLLVKSLQIVGSRMHRLYLAVRAGAIKPALDGCFEGLRMIPGMLAKRRQVQKMRTVRLGYVFSLMRGPVAR